MECAKHKGASVFNTLSQDTLQVNIRIFSRVQNPNRFTRIMYPLAEEVINDLKSLKDAIRSDNLLICHSLRKKYSVFVRKDSEKQWEPYFMRTDKLATHLLPQDIPNGLVPKKVTGDGNCLFNAVSVILVGNQRLSLALRVLAAVELYLHADFYAHHPK